MTMMIIFVVASQSIHPSNFVRRITHVWYLVLAGQAVFALSAPQINVKTHVRHT